jgi:endogenous inhibitor of DNA gyrase (YacG/DUF329 family)
MDIPIEYPLDADGFLRRECPSCAREFKWHYGPIETRPADAVDPPRYTCPLCGKQADHNQWFTRDQVRCQQEAVDFYAMDAINDEMKNAFGRNYTPGKNNAPAPTPLHEPNDMLIIEPPCHPWEPVKVAQERADSGPLFCLVCGEGYSA